MSQRPHHLPQRTCVVCRRKQPKRDLTRIVRDADGRLALDPTARAPGRGAYLCPAPACWAAAATGGQLAHALRTDLQPDDRTLLQTPAPGRPQPGPPATPENQTSARYAVPGEMTR